jgi:hypothetical protein
VKDDDQSTREYSEIKSKESKLIDACFISYMLIIFV